MNSYAEIDGVPVAADDGAADRTAARRVGFHRHGRRGLLRGAVPADAARRGRAGAGDAAGLALRAGIDVELPTVDAFGPPLLEAVRSGAVDEALDRPRAAPGADAEGRTGPARRGLAAAARRRRRALPSTTRPAGTSRCGWPGSPSSCCATPAACCRSRRHQRVALVGPRRRRPDGDARLLRVPGARRRAPPRPRARARHPVAARGARPRWRRPGVRARVAPSPATTRPAFAAAVAAAAASDVCVLAVGDRAGLFGRGTSGEGCDATDLRLPGVQADLVRAVLATGTPVVLVLLTGRPYALGPDVDAARRHRAGVLPRASAAGRRWPRCSPAR